MKKKGFCFKRAISLLLAAAMILTAAPQTSLTALAVEQGMTADVPDESEDLDILTTEDGTDVDADESADVPSDNADQSDDAGDNSEDPDGIMQDNDAGDSDETADPEEGMDNDLTTDGEFMLGNDLTGRIAVFGNESDEEPVEELGYKGEIREPEGNEGRRLIINEIEAEKEYVEIVDILRYYEKQIELGECGIFNCVEFDVKTDPDSNSISMKKDEINGAISIMDKEKNQIDYLYWSEDFEVTCSLCQLREATEDIPNVKFTVTPMSHQGVKINSAVTKFPAESVGVSYNKHAMVKEDAFAECWDGAEEGALCLLALDNDSPSRVIESTGIWFNEGEYTDDGNTIYVSGFGISIEETQAGQDYLITPLYTDKGSVAMGKTKELTAGERSGSSDGVSDAAWKSLDESLITIEAGDGAAATLTAKDKTGEAYYYVKYTCDSKEWLELHSLRVAYETAGGGTLAYLGEVRQDKFEDGDLAGTEYRRLVINEYEAKEKNKDAEIADILTYYAEQIAAEKCEKFNCVELNMDAVSSETLSFPMKADDINGAISIMDTENKEIGNYWIDYNFWNEADNASVSYSLNQLRKAEKDLDAACTVTPMPHQGVKINLKNTEFPAEFFGVSYNKNQKDAYAECWDNAQEENLRLLALDEGVTPGVIEPGGMWFGEFTFEGENGPEIGSNFGMGIEGMQAGHDYLITPLYADEGSVAMGTTKELTAGGRSGASDGAGVSDAAWKSLDESLITIEPGTGTTTTLTAKDKTGEAYYYVTYKCGDKEWLELHSVRVADAASEGELAYLGEVRPDRFNDGDLAGTPYRRLIINEYEAKVKNNGAEIADILTYYAEQIAAGNYEPFNCVELNMDAVSSSETLAFPMKKDDINGAISIMDTKNEKIGYWIDYNFWNEADNAGLHYSLNQPREAEKDLDAACTVTPMPYQGVKINLKNTEFPAEFVCVSYNKNQKDAYAECWSGAKQEELRLLALDEGVTPGVTEPGGMWFGEFTFEDENGSGTGSNFGMDIEGMQAGHDYLITPLYADEGSVPTGTTKELTAGGRSGSADGVLAVTWKSLDESLISIAPGTGAAATLTAKVFGEAYYYVTYTRDGKEWLELHSVQVTYGAPGGKLAYIGDIIRDKFEDGDLAGKTYLRLRIDEMAAVEENKDKDLTPILDFYKEKGLKVNCVEFVINGTSETDRVVKKDYINNALSVMDTENNEIGYWIDYNFQKYEAGKESWEYTAFSLNMPGSFKADIDANVTVTPVAGQGVKLKFPRVDFNAENVVVNFGSLENWDEIKKILEDAGGEGEWQNNPYCLFTLKSDQPELYEDDVPYNVDCDMNDKRFWVCNVCWLKADTEYLMAPVKNAESMNVRETKALTLPASATGITWKSYTPNVISINTKNGKTELSAQSRGEALYGVIYKEGGVQKDRFYRMKVENELYKIDFLDKEIKMKVGDRNYLHVVCYPSDAGIDSGDLTWTVEPADSKDPVVGFITDEDGKMRGEIIAAKPGKVTVTAAYPGKENLKATCTITVEGRLDWEDVADEADNMDLYAVSGCDTKLSDVKFPEGTASKWEWKDPNRSLAPYAGSEGHLFTAVCTRPGGWSGEHTLWVRMINVTGINMQSRMPKSTPSEEEGQQNSSNDKWDIWNKWGIPTVLEKGDELSLGFWYNMDGINWNDDEGDFDSKETAAVEKKLAEKYKVEWSSSPKDLGKQQSDDTYEYTASILKKPEKAEKKTFTVSVKDKATNRVVWKTSHTLTVAAKALFDWGPIRESYYWENLKSEYDQDKMTALILTVKMPKTEYDKWGLTYTSLDNTILQLKTPTVTSGSVKGENNQDMETTIVKIPCIQKGTGRVWIQITAKDEIKSSERFDINLEDKAPTILSAATQTINKASTERSVPIVVSTSEFFPLVKKTDGTPDVSIQEVKIGSKAASDCFELTEIRELSNIGVYSMNLGLKSEKFSEVKTGNYTVKLRLKTAALWEDGKEEEQTVSLTVKVTDVKPKVTFKQTKKVNLFYTDEVGAGTLQINTGEEITKVELKNYVDNKNSNRNADCHYELKNVDGVYKIVRKPGQNGAQPEGSLKKGILEYEVAGYSGSFQTTFTVATENKAPAIVLSTKADTLYPVMGYYDSWISMTDKATGESFVPTEAKWYTGRGQNRKEEPLTIGEFGDPDSTEQKNKEKEITGAKGNKYGLFVTNDGNIVSRLRNADSYDKKADTINLELKKANWSKPVAVSYKLQVNTATPKLALGKATLTLNKNAAVYRGQQERTTLRLKGFNDLINHDSWVTITGQDDKSKAELIGKDSSLAIWYWDYCGDVVVRFNDNDIAAGTYKFKISVGKNGGRSEYASTVLTVKIVDKTVKQSLKVTAKGSIDVMNREGTFISYTPKISNLTGTIEDGWLAGKDAYMFDCSFEDGKLIVRAGDGTKYSTKVTYEIHTVFRVQTRDWRSYEVSSDNVANAKPFKIKVKQGKPKLKMTAVGGNTLYRQRNNSVDIRIEAMLGKQEVEIESVSQANYWGDLTLKETAITVWEEDENGEVTGHPEYVIYNPETKCVRIALQDPWNCEEIRKNGTYKMKLTVRYRDKASDVKEAQITCPIAVR